MCGILCCFGFLSCLGCRDVVARQMVFFPPPPGYVIHTDGDNVQSMLLVDADGVCGLPIKVGPMFSCDRLQHLGSSNQMATLFIRHGNPRFTLLFSHGNATDIGYMRAHLCSLSDELKVNVFAYDYAGYGLSDGKCSVRACERDIETAFAHLTGPLGIDPKTIVLYGQSLGTAPTTSLAAKLDKNLAGVVLHSPLMSGLRVIRDVDKTYWFDILSNVDVIHDVHAPVLIIHGVDDEDVPVHHGTILFEKSKQKYQPWFVEDAGHNDIEVKWRGQYFDRVHSFLVFLESGDCRSQTSIMQ